MFDRLSAEFTPILHQTHEDTHSRIQKSKSKKYFHLRIYLCI